MKIPGRRNPYRCTDYEPLRMNRAAGGRVRHWLKIGQYLFLIIAALFLGRTALSYGRLRIVQMYESWQFDHDVPQRADSMSRSGQLPPTVSSIPRVEEGELLGRLKIPRIGISAMVLEGDDEDILEKAAGHIPSTALPGERGNFVIAAHRDTLFRGLKNIRKDDTIIFSTPSGTHQYRVESLEKVSPNDVQVLKASAHPTLTLVTCYPFNFIGHAPLRFIVKAAEIDGAPGTGPDLLTATAAPMEDGMPARALRQIPEAQTPRPRLVAMRPTSDEATILSPSLPAESQSRNSSSFVNSNTKLRPLADPETGTSDQSSASSASGAHSPSRPKRMQRNSLSQPDAVNASTDDNEHADAAPSHPARRFSKIRTWLGSLPGHFKRGHAETPTED